MSRSKSLWFAWRPAISGLVLTIVAALEPHALLAVESSPTVVYQLQPTVVGAGGARMQAANGWTLDGTVGQSDAIVQNGASGVRLDGGFWRAVPGATPVSDRIFANAFELPPGALGKP
ncbi:MAG: hypothetical protein WBV61_01530 [Rhodanobacteraceae bacterium]